MKDIWYKVFKISKHKSLELEAIHIGVGFNIYNHGRIHQRGIEFESNLCNLIGASFNWDWKRDHAGIHIDTTLFGWTFAVTLYDVRHWNYDKDDWETYDEIDGEYYLGEEHDN